MRVKRPDYKSAQSILEAAARDMKFTLKLEANEESGNTIIRNIYESFRMLGDAIMVSEGLESLDHQQPIRKLLSIEVKTNRPIRLIDELRKLRNNINYYGYKPSIAEIKDARSIANTCFEPLLEAIRKKYKNE